MGTRSLTIVQDHDFGGKRVNLVCIYRQFDGYPTGHGQELKDLLGEYTIVNGFNMNTPTPAANGMGCLAAQLVCLLKQDNMLGGIYLEPTNAGDCGQEYIYTIFPVKDKLHMSVQSGYGKNWKEIYVGPISEFDGETVEKSMR